MSATPIFKALHSRSPIKSLILLLVLSLSIVVTIKNSLLNSSLSMPTTWLCISSGLSINGNSSRCLITAMTGMPSLKTFQTSRSGLQRNRQALQRLSRDDNLMRLHAHLRLKRLDSGRIDALHGRHRSHCFTDGQRFLASEQFVTDAHLVHAARYGIAEACVSEGLDSPRIRCVVVFHMRHLMLFFERYISRVPSC